MVLQEILDWSEVWALLIPLIVLWKYPKQPTYFKPVIIYLWLALLIDIVIDVGWKIKDYYPQLYEKYELPWLRDNNYLYHIHSIVRFICFSTFFIRLGQPYQQKVKRIIPYIALLLLFVNFVFFENFFLKETFSSNLLATEAGLLLFYCLQYYLFRLQEESVSEKRPADYWIVLGLSIYVVVNFFYFLFYNTLDADTKMYLWHYHNVSFIIFCIFIAKGFYAARHN